MSKPMVRIHDLETNEIIDREMNAAEFKQYQKDQDAIGESILAAQAEAETKAEARQAILDRIGLTVDELQTILG